MRITKYLRLMLPLIMIASIGVSQRVAADEANGQQPSGGLQGQLFCVNQADGATWLCADPNLRQCWLIDQRCPGDGTFSPKANVTATIETNPGGEADRSPINDVIAVTGVSLDSVTIINITVTTSSFVQPVPVGVFMTGDLKLFLTGDSKKEIIAKTDNATLIYMEANNGGYVVTSYSYERDSSSIITSQPGDIFYVKARFTGVESSPLTSTRKTVICTEILADGSTRVTTIEETVASGGVITTQTVVTTYDANGNVVSREELPPETGG